MKGIDMNKKIFGYMGLIFVLMAPLGLSSQEDQEVKAILGKVADFYASTSNYTIQMKHQLLRGGSGNIISESYEGSFVKQGDFSKLTMLNSEVIQFPGVRLVIDHDSKAMEYDETATNSSAPMDLNVFSKYYQVVSMTSIGNQYVCELTVIPTGVRMPYGKVILHIDKDRHSVEKQVLFLTSKLPFKTKDGKSEEDIGRLVIALDHDMETMANTKEKLSNYLSKSGNRMVGTGKCKGYQVINLANK